MHKYTGVCLAVVLASLIILMPMTQPVSAQTFGPWAESLLVHAYSNPDAMFQDFDQSILDMVNGPLATWWSDKFPVDRMYPVDKYWVDRWTGNEAITLRSYAEDGKVCFDLNCQRWPTGLTLPRTLDPATRTYKHYQNYSDPWEVKAREFRRAIAYLTDKDGYIDRILSGYGYRMDTTVPTPILAGYVNLDVSGANYPYNFNATTAATVLDAAGFTQGTTLNPYYPTEPEGWEAQHIRIDPKGDWSVGGPETDLKPLTFYVRWDDRQRLGAAQELALMLRKSGIPIELRLEQKNVCFEKVMNLYDYHLYTGGWSMDVRPTWVYFLYCSPAYWGGNASSYFDAKPGSVNYVGYCTNEYDMWSGQACFTTDPIVMKEGVMESQEIYVRDCPVIDLWAAAAYGAYKSKWSCVVNMEGFGIANHWSFFEMNNTVGDTTIDWGICNVLADPHVVSAKTVWDRAIVDLVYEGLITLNPYNYAIGEEVGVVCDFENPLTCGMYGTPAKSVVTYHLRDDVYFHSVDPISGDPIRQMLPYDAAFSLIFLRDVGPDIYWYNRYVGNIDYIEVQNNAPTAWAAAHPHVDIRSNPDLGPNDMAVYFKVASIWARFWGSQNVMDSYLWLTANDVWNWGFGTDDWNPARVLLYKPWEMDADSNGVMDMYEDGTGAWVMDGTSGGLPGTWLWVSFHANRNYYWTQETISYLVQLFFHYVGNVNWIGATNPYPSYDLIIDIMDGSYIRNAFGTTPSWPHGTGPGQWNVDCDTDFSNSVWARDLYLWAHGYGSVKG